MIEHLKLKMIEFDKGDAKRIQHFLKVHSFAKTIGIMENISPEKQYILELSALVHDIGIHLCEEKYKECNGKLQEKEGPALAEEILKSLDIKQNIIDRVKYLVGHHHTYNNIDDIDYQILVEADFLVNMFEDNMPKENINITCERIFKTTTGKQICKNMFTI